MRGALGIVCLLVLGCGGNDSPPDGSTATSGLEREIRDFSLTETQGGRPMWELRAEYAFRIPQQNRFRLEDIQIVFYDGEGEVSSRLTARRGYADQDTGEMTALDRVRLVSSVGETLSTDELTYLRDEDLVRGPGFVRLAKRDQILTGYDFRSRPDLTDYKIERDVHITVSDQSGHDDDRR